MYSVASPAQPCLLPLAAACAVAQTRELSERRCPWLLHSLPDPHCSAPARLRLPPQEKLPWFLDSLPSAACAKGGAGAYSDAIQVGRRLAHNAA